MLSNSKRSGPGFPPIIQVVSALVCLIFALSFIDGLWGFGQTLRLLVTLSVIGLGIILIAFYSGKDSMIGAVGVVLAASMVGCLIMECVLRLFIAVPTIPVDEKGFQKRIVSSCPHPVETQVKEGVYRILGLSDSFGLAGGENNYHFQVANLLSRSGVITETINLSVSGAHPKDEYWLLSRFGTRFKPKLILHGVFVGNDFYYPVGKIVEIGGLPIPSIDFPRYLRPQNFLLFRWIRAESKLIQEKVRLQVDRWKGLPTGGTSQKEFLRIESKYLLSCKKDAPQWMEWAKTLDYIHLIQNETTKMGAKYLMVIHPDQCQVDSLLRNHVKEWYRLNLEDFDLDLPQRYLKEDCEKRGIPCLDLLPSFREQGDKGGLYHFHDTHYNESGNRLAAQLIEEFLFSQELITTP